MRSVRQVAEAILKPQSVGWVLHILPQQVAASICHHTYEETLVSVAAPDLEGSVNAGEHGVC